MTRSYDVCTNGCYLYSPGITTVNMCPVCEKPDTFTNTTKIVSVADKVAEILSCKEIKDDLINRQNEVANTNGDSSVYNDFRDGQIYKDLYNNSIINNDPEVLNVFIKIDVDGFTCSSSRTSMIMIHAVVLNLDSSERY